MVRWLYGCLKIVNPKSHFLNFTFSHILIFFFFLASFTLFSECKGPMNQSFGLLAKSGFLDKCQVETFMLWDPEFVFHWNVFDISQLEGIKAHVAKQIPGC